MPYGYQATLKARPGHRDEVIAILLRGVDGLRAAGCRLYAVGVSDVTDPDLIWVNELWESKEQHDASLLLPETKAAIAEALPLLTGEVTGQELTVVGGLGV
ncbi:quinol monooxygenase YgiN [Streptomyces sp. 2333.5]|uniref:putative quinol monooxygenase n=1 Tax=unclassified Streptomyces TaxID=2593676 RepID=UPI00089504F2|nr:MULTISPECIES: putative quinol monooxygenase [unclassified Streptomyces]PJJ05401.1 quinol monooxygenase YgiN [Streptomyces sp. 2333.5]SEE75071.1 Quinol monooxygenase YgiN [Streptomyces sp. 2314.4]SEE98620.1 Quinol monooxygenase YgiN [Streptomyces sp. 2112.2]SOE10208.1 Quinol monooxygenase YgiN [Streptomyces sp. 2323.1]